jgi:hypothetical protein
VVTHSFKRGVVWRIDFKKKKDFRQKIWVVLPFGNFSQKKNGCVKSPTPHCHCYIANSSNQLHFANCPKFLKIINFQVVD